MDSGADVSARPASRDAPLPVVLVHGLRINGAVWTPLARRLARHRTVLTPDLPAHGSRRGTPFALDDAAAALVDDIGRLGGRVVLVGHSLGGAVCMRAAATAPDAVAGLVGIGCTFPARGGRVRPFYRVLAHLFEHHGERLDRWSDKGFRRMLPAEIVEPTLAAGTAGAALPGVLEAVSDVDPVADLRRYAGPVWLVNGGLDQFRLGERACLAACQDGRLAVWPGLNHVTILAETDRLERLVEDACAVAERR